MFMYVPMYYVSEVRSTAAAAPEAGGGVCPGALSGSRHGGRQRPVVQSAAIPARVYRANGRIRQ